MEHIVKCLTCAFWSDLAKYVLNSCEFDSECSDCCKIHFVTTEIAVDGSEEEVEAQVEDCCIFRHKK